MEGRATVASRIGGPLERLIYRVCGTDPSQEMTWAHYAVALLVFNLLGALVIYGLQRLQPWLPLNPQHQSAVSADSAFNTAVAFVTKTDLEGDSGEATMNYLTQMAGATVPNYLSAPPALAVA